VPGRPVAEAVADGDQARTCRTRCTIWRPTSLVSGRPIRVTTPSFTVTVKVLIDGRLCPRWRAIALAALVRHEQREAEADEHEPVPHGEAGGAETLCRTGK
jgi:hypothetical protein